MTDFSDGGRRAILAEGSQAGNGGSQPVPFINGLSPLGTVNGSGALQYYLNCQAISEIPASGSVTFDMQLPVPATTGDARHGWTLQGTSVATGGAVTITAPSAAPLTPVRRRVDPRLRDRTLGGKRCGNQHGTTRTDARQATS